MVSVKSKMFVLAEELAKKNNLYENTLLCTLLKSVNSRLHDWDE